jgi:cellulose synthase/poly-beta-1,6-N-acetylglucosamine synthase-like glycosyltransferase/peptidoglycan/xylan/chitin deacetylase (PgdA/CDA1 family)/spore germination protein YaaH
MRERKPIFYDEQQRRWRRTRRVLEVSGSLLTLVMLTFFFSLVWNPDLPGLLLPSTRSALHAVREKRGVKAPPARPGRRHKVAALGKIREGYDPLRAAFYVSWDPTSLVSLQQHYRDIDLLLPEALHAVSPDGRLDVEMDPKLLAWLQTSGVELPTMALVNNYDGVVWRIRELAALLARPESRQRLVSELTRFATDTRQAGLAVDFEEVPAGSQVYFRQFVQELARSLHGANLKLMVTLPAADRDYDYAYFAKQVDAIILMDYDQHWLTSAPGPIAAQDWFARNLDETLREVPPEKLVVAIANYAYDWTEPRRRGERRTAKSVSFQQSIVTAQESEATVEFEGDSLNPHFSYYDENNHMHRVWILDGVTAYNQLRAAERLGVRGTALWRLGSEDPSLWSIWDVTQPDDTARAKLKELPPGYDLVLEGDGDIWRILSTPQAGRRTFHYDGATETIVDESLETYPVSYRIDQMGGGGRKIALTFDDGPDPRFTPHILDILKRKQVSAAFFVTGDVANQHLGLLRRIYEEGHEIGNHTYTHPHFDQISRKQLKIELNLTEWLLGSTLGIKTLLFRPPYGIDHQPETADEIALLPIPQSLGYVIVGSKIDPHDWGEAGGQPPPPAEEIVRRVVGQALAGKGHIILLHDGGGDRSHTVAALPQIIEGLRAQGFELVSVSALLGQTRAQVMPPLDRDERWLARVDAFIFNLYHWLRLGIAGIFIVGIALAIMRTVFIGLLALIEKMRPGPSDGSGFRARVSVLIPAYNEEEVIVQTIHAALNSDYPLAEVIVVDDGSTDGTSKRIGEVFGSDPRVQLYRQSNQGKPAALNRALTVATGELLITIDADTTVDRDAIGKLVRHFADARVGAVAGNAKVANRNRWLTRWQALEYITSQNLERRAFDLLNCITVVPGAVGAWRREAVLACGGFSHDTLAEDTDLTLAIRRGGWRILYDEEAIGRTMAPETARALVRQRFRWTFGTLQAVWKHRGTLGRRRHGTMGWIGLPNIFLFQILLPLFSPVIDALFVGSLVLWGLARIHWSRIPQLWTAEDVERSVFFFLAFMLIDLLTCVIAFALEKDEDWSLLVPLLLQRFYYRQMMYVVLFRTLVRAMQGRAVGWEGIEREISTPVSHA